MVHEKICETIEVIGIVETVEKPTKKYCLILDGVIIVINDKKTIMKLLRSYQNQGRDAKIGISNKKEGDRWTDILDGYSS